jgi:hypothetical protein
MGGGMNGSSNSEHTVVCSPLPFDILMTMSFSMGITTLRLFLRRRLRRNKNNNKHIRVVETFTYKGK